MTRIVIIGAGNIGNAIADVLRPKKFDIALWDAMPKQGTEQKPLAELVPTADFIFFCVPSFAIPDAIAAVKPYLSRRAVLITVAKGIEKKSGKTMDEIFGRLLPRRRFALLSGPMLAGELSGGMGGAAVIASKSVAARKAIAALFKDTELCIALSADIRGVACAGVLKNIYAIILGAADGMGFGYNIKGFLLGGAQAEIAAMLPLLGGKRATADIAALSGDLFATGMSPASNNHAFGAALAKNATRATFTEGMVAAPLLQKRLGKRVQKFPLFMIASVLVRHPEEGEKMLKRHALQL